MKKRLFCLLLIAALLPLPGCGAPAAPSPSPTVQATPAATAETTPEPSGTQEVSPSPAPEPSAPEVYGDWAAIFTDFLRENYDSLNTLCYGGIAGVGFIDLDLDGTPELLLFDAGASAAMGVQFFDIADGREVCVSANNPDLRQPYGAGYFTDVYVNANYFDDFRLMEDQESGERYFLVESGNGAEDFLYREVIRFGRDGSGVLTLTSLLYRYESYSPDDSGNMVLSSANYTQNGQSITGAEYTAAYDALFASVKQTDYTPAGVFIWEVKDYDGGLESFLSLVQTAVERYIPIPG